MDKKDHLKALFETGKIPMGEHFAEFIDDAYNNYKLVDMFNPNQQPDEFEEGENVLVFNYNPVDNPDWLALFGPNVAAGDIMVRTLAYPEANVWLQEFDTNRNGRYYANKSRSSTDGVSWGAIVDHPEVLKVNGLIPDDDGNVDIGGGGGKPTVYYTWKQPEAAEGQVTEFTINLPDYNPTTDLLSLFRGGTPMSMANFEIVSYANPVMEVKLNNGWWISSGNPLELFRYKYSNGDGGGEVIVSKPEVTFHTYQYELGTPNWVYEFDIEVPNYNPDTDVIELYRTSGTNPNRVKQPDFEIVSYSEPIMHIALLNGSRTNRDYPIGLWRYKYSNNPRLDATVVDGFGSTSSDDASSINNVTILDNKVTSINDELVTLSGESATHMAGILNLNTDLNDHIMTRGDEQGMGHVQVDGTTIISNNGIISAVSSATPIEVVDNTDTEDATKALSANQGKIMKDNAVLLQAKVDAHIVGHYATSMFVGHVKPDGVTTFVDGNGVISAIQTPGPPGPEGSQGLPGERGETGDRGERGEQGLQGIRGEQGIQGEGFSIAKSYSSISEMDSSYSTDGIAQGKFVIIANPINGSDIDNGKVYVKSDSGYVFVVNMSGSQGVTGPRGEQGIQGIQGERGERGEQGLIIPDESRQIKMWTGTTVTSGGDGSWVIDYTAAGFTQVRSIQVTLESSITAAADKPLGTYVASKNNTTASGKAYKVSSAGLLAAMQQVSADNGVTVHVLVIGH